MQNLPSDPVKLKQMIAKLLQENLALKNSQKLMQKQTDLAKSSAHSLQSLAQNPNFQNAALLAKNQELQIQLQDMLETQRLAKREILNLKSELSQSTFRWQTEMQKQQNDHQLEIKEMKNLQQILTDKLTTYSGLVSTVRQNLQIKEEDTESIELIFIGEVENMKQTLQQQQIQIHKRDSKIDDLYEQQQELINEIEKAKNDANNADVFEQMENQVQELAGLLELQQAQLIGIRNEKSNLIDENQVLKRQIESLAGQVNTQTLAAHLLVPLNEKIEELEHINFNLTAQIQGSNEQKFIENQVEIEQHVEELKQLDQNEDISQLSLSEKQLAPEQSETLDSLIGSLIQSSQQEDQLKMSLVRSTEKSISVEEIDNLIQTKHNDLYARVMQRRVEKQKLMIQVE